MELRYFDRTALGTMGSCVRLTSRMVEYMVWKIARIIFETDFDLIVLDFLYNVYIWGSGLACRQDTIALLPVTRIYL